MKIFMTLSLINCLIVSNVAKLLSRCEVANKLSDEGLDGYDGYSLENWVCLAFFASKFNTTAEHKEEDGSTSYGIFQINSKEWCTNHEEHSRNRCHHLCSGTVGLAPSNLDKPPNFPTYFQSSDLSNSIECAKKIIKEKEGMGHWYVWKENCQNSHGLKRWLYRCDE
ncbi:lysozyme-like protein 4 isoform X1 [Ornithorhynchus anatinus]|uniref:lysozyme-like protein 4 isoform X1 n=1 Tax=Ornithorhynchus anatinus TaxID=9258 RepID=UPI000155C03C|nr:lysozyme-like protein 4 isoform X1 [Ornithorhynchus anatinus]XP_039768835.1 lysozyme-like protein 4 isoform X1 [Ornithorhynchus anatinus]XP_039768836.1 lysozyme-like protein 4 isoform X1 [Ornithorhynchus anatinus]